MESFNHTQHRGSLRDLTPKPNILAIIIAAVAIIIIGGVLAWALKANMASGVNVSTAIDSKKYQAVFFTNGQVYFGKLQTLNNDYLKLTDIFYLQSQSDSTTTKNNPQTTQSNTADSSNLTLIKLGNEIHAPEDEMIVAKDQLLFFENIKPNGNVASTIKKYNDTHK